MGRPSTIARLPEELRELVHALLRQGRTIEEVRAHLASMLGEEAPSKSAIGRYKQRFEEMAPFVRATQEAARAMVGGLQERGADDKVKQAVSDSLAALMLRAIMRTESGGEVSAKEIATMAASLRDLAMADKAGVERLAKAREEIRKEEREKAATTAVESVKNHGLSAQAADEIRRAILGMA